MKNEMKYIVLFLILCSCKHEVKKNASNITQEEIVEDTFYDSQTGITEYIIKNDINYYSLEIKDSLKIKSTQISPGHGYCSEITYGKIKRFIDFDREEIIYKTPETSWLNNDFLCIHTFSDLSIGYDLFIPYKTNKAYLFLKKDIKEVDKQNNNIVYVDTVSHKEIKLAVMNLNTTKQKFISINIEKHKGIYPYFSLLTLTKNKLLINIDYPKRKIELDITKINNGI